MKRILSTIIQKWPEYIIEALVIFASIFGAFALDNWNINRTETRKAESFITELEKELTESEKHFKECIAFHQSELELINNIKSEYLQFKRDSALFKMIVDFSDTAKTKRPNPPRLVIDHLMLSGSLEYLPNISLAIQQLVNAYDNALNINQMNSAVSVDAQLAFRSKVDPFILRSDKPSGYKEHALVAGWMSNKDSEQYLLFFQWIDLLQYYHRRNIVNYQPVINQIISLRESL